MSKVKIKSKPSRQGADLMLTITPTSRIRVGFGFF